MTEAAHPTTTPEQCKTDTWAVFADNPQDPYSNFTLLKRVEVPRYTQPNADGVKMDMGKRLALAVHRAVTAEDSAFPVPGVQPSEQDYSMAEGKEFIVMTDLESSMSFAEFEQNPEFDGVWNPEDGA